ncbi:Protein little zipper 1 [Heracleum sosnowskyi]|uniref:Protein little zipper 1 n=1 Tax=Heracleum sosnowskyi TaxID=360622 RepID=A0AAD8IG51_9APIA|nr:Protein little zipper 1 [Heracleum sosnowskyi]
MSFRSTPSERTSSSFSLYKRKTRSKRYRIQVHALKRMKRSGGNSGDDMKEKNLKLYMQNITIFHENEKLRIKARLLHQENLSLMSEIQKKKLSHHHHCVSSTLNSSTSSPPNLSP